LTETSALPNAITETYAGKEFSAFEIATLFVDGGAKVVGKRRYEIPVTRRA
jgi:hypothetical protein